MANKDSFSAVHRCVFILLLSMALMLSPVQSPQASEAPPEAAVTLTVLGDSLSAGYGLSAPEAFPSRLEQALREAGTPVRVINAGVSGDTTAGGLSRLEWLLADRPDVVLVELGGNDALRGLSPRTVENNLSAILAELKNRGVGVVLAGMRAPRNLGDEYRAEFDAVFPRLAERFDVPFYPFFLEGVAGETALNQPDGIHPNSRGVDEIVRRILPLVRKTLEGLETSDGKNSLTPTAESMY